MSLREIYERIKTRDGQKLKGTFVGREAFEAAGGEWDEASIQWVDYWEEDDREDETILYPWVDFTLMLYSREVGDYRPATEEDLKRIGFRREA